MSSLNYDLKQNACAFLDDTHPKTADYHDIISWIKSSRIYYAVSHCPDIYDDQIKDFWKSAAYFVNKKAKYIQANVRGVEIKITVEDVAKALKLEEDCGDVTVLYEHQILDGFLEMGYEGMDYNKKEIKKTLLPKEWRYLAHVFIMCICPRKGGTDAMNYEWAAAMLNFCKKRKANIATLVFKYMADNIQAAKKEKWLLYPRFVQMILNHLHKDIPNNGVTVQLSHMHPRIFADTANPHTTFSGKNITFLFDHMYSPERLVYIKKLKLDERKREAEKKEKRKMRTMEKEDKKRKKYEGSSNLRLRDEPFNVDEPLVRKSKKARARSPSPTRPVLGQEERIDKRNGKQHVTEDVELESDIRRNKKKRLNEEVIRSFSPVVADELSMLKTKMARLLNRENDREKKIADLTRLVLKQQKGIKTLSSMVIELQQKILDTQQMTVEDLDTDNAVQGTSSVPNDIVDLEIPDETVIGAVEETEKEKKDNEAEDEGGEGSGLGNKDDGSAAEFDSDDDNPTSDSVIKVLLNLKNNLMSSTKSKSMFKSKSTH